MLNFADKQVRKYHRAMLKTCGPSRQPTLLLKQVYLNANLSDHFSKFKQEERRCASNEMTHAQHRALSRRASTCPL